MYSWESHEGQAAQYGSGAIAASEPLAVLVNKGTASASEILAGALKDNKRAVLYGEPTFGKGKIQSVFQLSDGPGLAVTVARYETPARTGIDKDEGGFCGCLQDSESTCYVNRGQLFARFLCFDIILGLKTA
ncbi:hypothetical protein POTOM_037588 [Populus tomentosa]|uniref:Tail specific protease domain-containing protein n=1 Tax=Populus tomentosa TaxID=118781 RepID=A0A8X8CCQ1_POPTO|nr:hypothetical protein POTOM_037588 [Populus tomentosa]